MICFGSSVVFDVGDVRRVFTKQRCVTCVAHDTPVGFVRIRIATRVCVASSPAPCLADFVRLIVGQLSVS